MLTLAGRVLQGKFIDMDDLLPGALRGPLGPLWSVDVGRPAETLVLVIGSVSGMGGMVSGSMKLVGS